MDPDFDYDALSRDDQKIVDFLWKVDMEGLDYALTSYFSDRPHEIQHDAELAAAWKSGDIRAIDVLLTERRERLGCGDC